MPANAKVLWLHGGKGFTPRELAKYEAYLKSARIASTSVFRESIHRKYPDLWVKKGKDSYGINLLRRSDVHDLVRGLCKQIKPSILVVNDKATLGYLIGQSSLDLCRGSVYFYNGIPTIIVDELRKTYELRHGGWLRRCDLQKLQRWLTGTQRREPKFAYTVCHTVEEVRTWTAWLVDCSFQSTDIETEQGCISSVAYCGIHHDGTVHTVVIPFVNPLKPGNAHWETADDEVEVWRCVREINGSPAYKIFQNGQYDCAYFHRYRAPVVNWFLDTIHLFHAIYMEAAGEGIPKSLNFLASLFLDYARYWKDDIKGEEEERTFPSTPMGLEMFWRYNALDSHYTAFICFHLLRTITKIKWALRNYCDEFQLQIGPFYEMAMTGWAVHEGRQVAKTKEWERKAAEGLKRIRTLVADPEFNPASPDEVATLVYDVLKATPVRSRGKHGGNERSADEKILKLIQPQHWLLRKIISAIWDAKKPSNNRSKYGTRFYNPDTKKWRGLKTYRNRLLYSMNAAGTDTGRAASRAHYYWCGTNGQNIPEPVRDMLVADPGCVLLDCDFSQSDAWFVFYEAEEPKGIATLNSGLDTHCVHASHFFQRPYEEIYKRYKAKDPWAVHPLTGIRQITKKIVHGGNYQMSAFTLFILMGIEAVIAAAETLGATYRVVQVSKAKARFIHIPGKIEFPPMRSATEKWNDIERPLPPASWDINLLVDFCEILLNDYHLMYPGLRKWHKRSAQEVIRNGNLATCFGGRTRLFFGSIADDKKIQRELSAFYGQGGTSGNINRVLNHLFYRTDMRARLGVQMKTQTHDSITLQVPEQHLHETAKLTLTIMQEPVTIRGRTFRVPAEAKVGYSWGEHMMSYHENLTLEELRAAELKLEMKYAA